VSNWAVIQLDTLARRIEAWKHTRPYELVTYFDSERGKKALKYEVRNPLPLLINAEVGAIVNSIRSSLDILAVTLAKRFGATYVKDVYFPVSKSAPKSAAVFADKRVKGVNRLSPQDQASIKDLAPYKGGDNLLYALHQMDITRKHRQLLTVHSGNIRLVLTGTALDVVWPHELPVEERPEDQSILAWVNPSASDCKAELSVEPTLARTKPLQPKPPIPALTEFASLAHRIIASFD
jgi:hypothetical protein